MTDIHGDKILILDFGAQYTQLIARRVRELGVYCEIWAWDHDPAEIAAYAPKGIILSGGPESTTLPGAPRAPQEVFDSGLPVLGICYGMQTMAAQLGGATEAADAREFGHAEVEIVAGDALFAGLSDHALHLRAARLVHADRLGRVRVVPRRVDARRHGHHHGQRAPDRAARAAQVAAGGGAAGGGRLNRTNRSPRGGTP